MISLKATVANLVRRGKKHFCWQECLDNVIDAMGMSLGRFGPKSQTEQQQKWTRKVHNEVYSFKWILILIHTDAYFYTVINYIAALERQFLWPFCPYLQDTIPIGIAENVPRNKEKEELPNLNKMCFDIIQKLRPAHVGGKTVNRWTREGFENGNRENNTFKDL